jgi:hypothetical protein
VLLAQPMAALEHLAAEVLGQELALGFVELNFQDS